MVTFAAAAFEYLCADAAQSHLGVGGISCDKAAQQWADRNLRRHGGGGGGAVGGAGGGPGGGGNESVPASAARGAPAATVFKAAVRAYRARRAANIGRDGEYMGDGGVRDIRPRLAHAALEGGIGAAEGGGDEEGVQRGAMQDLLMELGLRFEVGNSIIGNSILSRGNEI